MNKKLLYFEIGSFAFCTVFSFIFHFLYEWTGSNVVIALISPVNESPWEHSKILFYPYLIYSVFEYFFFSYNENFIYAKARSLSVSVPFMIILFFTYSGVLGYDSLFMDILITILIVAHMNYSSYKALNYKTKNNPIFYIIFCFIILICILLFTFFPPHINLFFCPVLKNYGI